MTIDLSTYLSLDVGLDGLEAYDLRDLSQPTGTSEYDYDVELEGGSPEKVDESAKDRSEDADFVVDNEQNSSEEDCSESLIDSDECATVMTVMLKSYCTLLWRKKFLDAFMLTLRMMMVIQQKIFGTKCMRMGLCGQGTLMEKCL